jgi:Peptidase family M28
MKNRTVLFVLLMLLMSSAVFAQQPKTKPNAEIQKMLKEISAKNIETTIRKLASFGTRNTLSEQDNPTRGIGAARDYLFGEFQKISSDCGNCLQVEKQTFTQAPTTNGRVKSPTVLTNVYAILKGTTDPTRVYVVSGHYDSMCNLDATDATCDAPGANDDASGTAASLEMARVMSKHKFDATIIFMTVPGEEQGLLGATYFAEQAKKNAMNIEAMFTNDIIGGVTSYKNAPDRQSVRVFAEGVPSDETDQQANTRRSVGGENDSASRQLGRFIKETADVYSPKFRVQLIYRRDRYLRGGDHIPFLENGFAAVRFTEPHEDYTHQHQSVKMVDGKQYGDLPEFVDFDYVANVTRVNAAALSMLALAPAKPKNVGVLTKELTNDTDLKWDANTDTDLAGYEVVSRDTTSAFWTNSVFVGKVLTYKAKEMSKDNYFFGVRTVDKSGNKSPVVYPKPVR